MLRKWNGSHCLFGFDQYSTGWAVIKRKNYSLSCRRRNDHWVWNFGWQWIFSPKKRPCHIKSPSNTFTDLAVAEVIFFVSNNPIEKKQVMSKTRQIFSTFTESLRSMRTKMKLPASQEVLISTQSKMKQPASGDWVLYFIRADNTLFRSIGRVSMLKFRWNLNSQ